MSESSIFDAEGADRKMMWEENEKKFLTAFKVDSKVAAWPPWSHQKPPTKKKVAVGINKMAFAGERVNNWPKDPEWNPYIDPWPPGISNLCESGSQIDESAFFDWLRKKPTSKLTFGQFKSELPLEEATQDESTEMQTSECSSILWRKTVKH